MASDLEVPENYPYGLKNKEIKKIIHHISHALTEQRKASFNSLEQYINEGVAAYRTAMIQIGQSELQGRFSRRLAIMTVVISLISIFIAVYSIKKTNDTIRSSEDWKQAQLEILNKLEEKTSSFEGMKMVTADTIILKTSEK